MTTPLTVLYGRMLGIGDDALMYFYPAGDMDTIPWPLTSEFRTDDVLRYQLACALYGARECGILASDRKEVTLPDGTEFSIDGNMWKPIKVD